MEQILLSQMKGGLCYFDRKKSYLESFGWDFQNLGFYLAKTPYKIQTHTHLQELHDFPITTLKKAMNLIISAVQSKNEKEFVNGLNMYAMELKALGFLCETSDELLSEVEHSSILSKKGCGALGADVLLFVYDRSVSKAAAELEQEIKDRGLQVVANEKSITTGVDLRF